MIIHRIIRDFLVKHYLKMNEQSGITDVNMKETHYYQKYEFEYKNPTKLIYFFISNFAFISTDRSICGEYTRTVWDRSD
jgi:hypothetical protein